MLIHSASNVNPWAANEFGQDSIETWVSKFKYGLYALYLEGKCCGHQLLYIKNHNIICTTSIMEDVYECPPYESEYLTPTGYDLVHVHNLICVVHNKTIILMYILTIYWCVVNFGHVQYAKLTLSESLSPFIWPIVHCVFSKLLLCIDICLLSWLLCCVDDTGPLWILQSNYCIMIWIKIAEYTRITQLILSKSVNQSNFRYEKKKKLSHS